MKPCVVLEKNVSGILKASSFVLQVFSHFPIGSIVYCCTFFKETNSDGFFHVPEDCQHDRLYEPQNVLILRIQRQLALEKIRSSYTILCTNRNS